jgi:hypothetical protein
MTDNVTTGTKIFKTGF